MPKDKQQFNGKPINTGPIPLNKMVHIFGDGEGIQGWQEASPQQPSTVAEIVQNIEVKSQIALHKSMKDGNPKHHAKMIADAVAAINELRRQDMEYVIGEELSTEDIDPITSPQSFAGRSAENRLKRRQRAKIEERLNEPE